jgi:hypothetical protein
MSKKQKRRVPTSAAPVVREASPMIPISSDKPAVSVRPSYSRSTRTAAPVEFNPDYSYVMKDLKKIGILAVSFVSILVVLSFFLR